MNTEGENDKIDIQKFVQANNLKHGIYPFFRIASWVSQCMWNFDDKRTLYWSTMNSNESWFKFFTVLFYGCEK